MKKISKTILIISTIFLGSGFLFLSQAMAQSGNISVEFERTPLFNVTNFVPGESVSGWVKVTNNTNTTKKVITKALNVNNSDKLGNVLNLEIREGTTTLYNKTLSQFFNDGEVYLSDLPSKAQTQYDFIVTFSPEAGNDFQGKSLRFDLLIGFQGEEGAVIPAIGGGVGLTIYEEFLRMTDITETSITITWVTNYRSTSQVIYAKEGERHTLDLTDITGNPPKYGYERTTPEYDAPASTNGVTFHSVTITGLDPATTYYFRAVSHGSLAISREYKFTTLGILGEEKGEEATSGKASEVETGVEKPSGEEITYVPSGEETGKPAEEEKGTIGQEGVGQAPVTGKEEVAKKFSTEKLLAAIGAMPFNLRILILTLIVLFGFLIFWLIKKRRSKKPKK